MKKSQKKTGMKRPPPSRLVRTTSSTPPPSPNVTFSRVRPSPVFLLLLFPSSHARAHVVHAHPRRPRGELPRLATPSLDFPPLLSLGSLPPRRATPIPSPTSCSSTPRVALHPSSHPFPRPSPRACPRPRRACGQCANAPPRRRGRASAPRASASAPPRRGSASASAPCRRARPSRTVFFRCRTRAPVRTRPRRVPLPPRSRP